MQKLLTTYPPFNNLFIFCTQWLLWTLYNPTSAVDIPHTVLCTFLSLLTEEFVYQSIVVFELLVISLILVTLTIYTLNSVCIFSILFCKFPGNWQGEFDLQSRTSSAVDLSWPYCLIHRWYFREKLDDSHSQARVTKGFIFYLVLIL